MKDPGTARGKWSGRRKWLTASGCVLGLVFLAALLVWQLGAAAVTPLLRSQLQAMIAEQLNAELQIGSLEYLPPYGVRIGNARLVTPGPDGQPVALFQADRLELKLARLPLRSPLIIQSVSIDRPSVHLIQTAQGLVGRRAGQAGTDLVKDLPANQRIARLSEMFELRRVTLAGGEVVYDDRTVAGAVPLVWKDLNIDLRTEPQSGGAYAYHLTAGDGSVADVDARGTFLLDDLLIRLDPCSVRVKVDPAASTSQLPAVVQGLFRDYQVAGTLTAEVKGELPLPDPSAASITAAVTLVDASGRLLGADARLHYLGLKLTCATGVAKAANPTTSPAIPPAAAPGTPAPPILRVCLDSFDARGGDAFIHLAGANLVLNGATGGWGLTGLSGSVDPGTSGTALPRRVRDAVRQSGCRGRLDFSLNGSGPLGVTPATLDQVYADLKIVTKDARLQPPGFIKPLTETSDVSLHLGGGAVSISPVRARYQNDVLFLRSARLPLRGLPETVRLEQLAGAVTFDRRPATYPPPLADVIAQLNPRGPFFFDGNALLDDTKRSKEGGPTVDYRIRLTTDRGAATVTATARPVPLSGLRLEAVVKPDGVDLPRFSATVLTGNVTGTARLTFGHSLGYAADLRLREVDLNELAQVFVKPGDKPITVSGELNGELSVKGLGTGDNALEALTGNGRLEVARGELWKIPLMKVIADALGVGDGLTVGQASAKFSLAHREIRVSEAMVNAPALGIEGSGSIGLDGRVQLNVVASRLSRIDTTPGGLLYRVWVAGTVNDPAVSVVLAPELSQTVGDLFRRVRENLTNDPPPRRPDVSPGQGPER